MKSPNLGKTPQRGEVWLARLDPTVGSEIKKTRPCLIISSSVVNQYRRTVVVVPLGSSSGGAPPLMVNVQCAGRAAIAMIDQVRAVAKERLVRHIENLSLQQLKSIEDALREVLELD